MRKLFLIALLALPMAALAADPAGFGLWTAADLKAKEKKMTGHVDEHKIAIDSLANYGNHMISFTHREGPGGAELHARINDMFVVESGEATLLVGGTIPGSRTTAPGEVRGANVEGGMRHKLVTGDIVHIPVNTPHQLIVDPGKHFTYFVIKIAKP
jgi:mannose-6-phosphate isomerase-like protein (cupin superfamily)